jgi:hypothetical protein
MPDYNKAKIYAIRSHSCNKVYIGSTCQGLANRLSGHRRKHRRYLKGKGTYYTSYQILEKGDYYIELIEDYPCERKEQLLRREGEIIRQTKNCVNKYIAGRTDKEYSFKYRRENKEKVKEYSFKYRLENKQKIKEKAKQKHNCPCGGKYTTSSKSIHFKTFKHFQYYLQQFPFI